MKALLYRASRSLLALRRPTKQANLQALGERGETIESLTIREATESDIPALADLHVRTWRDTYTGLLDRQSLAGPTVEIREHQWREAFATSCDRWFCFVVANQRGQLVGFVKGIVGNDEHPDAGELNKIYLDREYQRLGLGRRLVGHAVRRFLERGMQSMSAYVEPRNPSCGFFEKLGGEWLREPDGSINHCWYIWRDLARLGRLCPIDTPGPRIIGP